jgi:hypothetical protein
MSTLKTQYKNWILKNLNSQLTYVNWLEKFNEIHNLPSDMSDWDVTLMDGLEDESYVSDDFQIGPDGAYEHTNDMTPREKASELIVKCQTTIKSLDYNEAKQCALICCNEVLGYMGADRGYTFWLEVKQEVEKF